MTAQSRAYWSGGRSFDMRHVPGPVYLTVEGERVPYQAVWLKPFDALRPVPGLSDEQRDLAALAYVCDYTILEPVLRVLGLPWAKPGLVTASLDHAMWFHRPGAAVAGDWLLYAQEAVAAEDGPRRRRRQVLHPRSPSPGHRGPRGYLPLGLTWKDSADAACRAPVTVGARRHLHPRPPAASAPVADDRVHHPGARVPGPAQRRHRAHRRSRRDTRSQPPRAAHPGRPDLDLRRAQGQGEPGGAGAHRGPRPGARAARSAPLAEQPVDGRRLARRAQGGRRRGDHHGRAARPRTRPDRRAHPAESSLSSITGSPRTPAPSGTPSCRPSR